MGPCLLGRPHNSGDGATECVAFDGPTNDDHGNVAVVECSHTGCEGHTTADHVWALFQANGLGLEVLRTYSADDGAAYDAALKALPPENAAEVLAAIEANPLDVALDAAIAALATIEVESEREGRLTALSKAHKTPKAGLRADVKRRAKLFKQTAEPVAAAARGFETRDGKIWHGDVFVCNDFKVTDRYRNTAGTGHGRTLAFKVDGRDAVIEVDDATLIDEKALYRAAVDAGLNVNHEAAKLFARLVSESTPTVVTLHAKKPGWQPDGRFLTPMGEVIGGEPGGGPIKWRDRPATFVTKPGGTLEGARETMEVIAEAKAWHLGFATLFGAAGPVLYVAGLETPAISGLYLYGETSRGKSTALMAAVGAWSDPRPSGGVGLACSARATANAMEWLVQNGNGTCLGVDDLQNGAHEAAFDLPYSIGNGGDKGRQRVDGTNREGRTWDGLTFIITGEKSQKELSAVSRKRGQHASGAWSRCPAINVSETVEPVAGDAYGAIKAGNQASSACNFAMPPRAATPANHPG